MHTFTYNALPTHAIFGSGSISRVAEEAKRLGVSKVLVLSTPFQRALADLAVAHLGDLSVGIYDQAVMHVPVESAQAGVEKSRELKADACLAIGGGSTIGLGKAIALESELPLMVVATTYSGSEMTPIWGLTENGIKHTGRDAKVLPRSVIYDPELTLGLPTTISAVSGMNAIAHAVEALYAENTNPVITLIAEEGIRALANALPKVVENPNDLEARSHALYGAWLCGVCLGSVGMALHHKLCHTLGGSFNLPHAEVHTVVLPYVTAYNRDAAPEAIARVARALGVDDAASGLHQLAKTIAAPTSLKEIGMQKEDLEKAAKIASSNPYYNPRPVQYDGILKLLNAAFKGIEPGA